MAIDRKKLVNRHHPTLHRIDVMSPFSVGNGEFAYTADITGLQTFWEDYQPVPLCTMTQWGWHSFPVSMDEEKLRLTYYETYGRQVGYAVEAQGQKELYNNLRQNPHRLNLATIGLALCHGDKEALLEDIRSPCQTLNLWQGFIKSEFQVFDETVSAQTCADPDEDAVSFHIHSKLVESGSLGFKIRFPYGSSLMNASDWHQPDRHSSELILITEGRAILKRSLDKDVYYMDMTFSPGLKLKANAPHTIQLANEDNGMDIFLTCRFSKQQNQQAPFGFLETRKRSACFWEKYWLSGGMIALNQSKDPRALELERRIILSQYLTAIQCSGSVPPAETGLTINSWYGKFHLEMHFWHAAHFALWGRPHLLEKSLKWYEEILPVARGIAASQGYKGARWPKMCDVSGRNAPSWIAVLLLWQQPHPIMLAELLYRANPTQEICKRYLPLVVESAEFMASFAHYDALNDRYVLGPPVIPVQETHKAEVTLNPAFELEYFKWGLETANEWLMRAGEKPDATFSTVSEKLSGLAVKDDAYLAHENCPDTYTKAPFNHDHPSMLGTFGVLPGLLVDRKIMKQTLKQVLKVWDFRTLWGWDFPMMAMCCARLGFPSLALDVLLMDSPKNTWLPNGHNAQGDSNDLPLYLPGNGGLLLAAGMMAAGWDGDNGQWAPGFPTDGTWSVVAEDIAQYI